jgi:hypothetical protein
VLSRNFTQQHVLRKQIPSHKTHEFAAWRLLDRRPNAEVWKSGRHGPDGVVNSVTNPIQQEPPMHKKLILSALAMTLLSGMAFPQNGAGAKFGARDPRTCASKKDPQKGAPTGPQMEKVFICQEEGVTDSVGGSQTLHLIDDLHIEVGKARPFQMSTDAWDDSDPSKPVYPIRGGYTQWSCGVIGEDGNISGHSCDKVLQPHASGICYNNTFGDWVCKFMDGNAKMVNLCPGTGGATECRMPAPKS